MRKILLAIILAAAASSPLHAWTHGNAVNTFLSWASAESSPQGAPSAEMPFVNALKSASTNWGPFTPSGFESGASVDPSNFDAQGYPVYRSDVSSFFAWSNGAPIANQYRRPGHYVVTWIGIGNFLVREAGAVAGNVLLSSCIGNGFAEGPGTNTYCGNDNCNQSEEMRGYIVGTVLTVTVAPTDNGIITSPHSDTDYGCALQIGQPISDPNGSGITINKFGTPTIITGNNTSGSTACNGSPCTGAGGTGTYRVNFSQTFASSGSPAAIWPGGRFEIAMSSEAEWSGTWIAYEGLTTAMIITGNATYPSQTARNVAVTFHCSNAVSGSCTPGGPLDSEAVYWTGQILDPVFKNVVSGNLGILRDLGLAFGGGNVTTWASRKPANYFSWSASEMRDSIYAGDHGGNPVAAGSTTITFTGSVAAGPPTTLTATSVSGGTLGRGDVIGPQIVGVIDNGAGTGATNGNILTVTSVLGGTVPLNGTVYNGATIGGNAGAVTNNTTITGNSTSSGGSPATCGGSACTGAGGTGTYLLSNSSNQFATANFTIAPPGVAAGQVISNIDSVGTLDLWFPQGAVSSESMSVTRFNYKVNFDAGPPADKENLIVKWPTTTANPATVYFSADNGTTYHPICNGSGSPQTAQVAPIAGLTQHLIYEGGLQCWMMFEGTVSADLGNNVPFGIINFIPPEVFAEMNAEVGANPWIVSPQLAVDPTTDFFTQYALYIKINYPGMVPGFETVNESWGGNQYAKMKLILYQDTGDTAWGAISGVRGTKAEDWTGKTASTMCQAVGAVFNFDTTKYRCIEGQGTDQDYNDHTDLTARLTGTAYVNQNTSLIPVQSGCAGPSTGPTAVIQTGCPTFTNTPAYYWFTDGAVYTYWGLGEQGSNAGDATGLVGSIPPMSQKEAQDAWNYIQGNETTRSTIMASYLATTSNPYQFGTQAAFTQTIYPGFYPFITTITSGGCSANATGIPPCHINGLVAYEGGYATPSLPQATVGNPTAFPDVSQAVTSATLASPCVLNTTISVTAYINDGLGAPPGDTTPGNVLSYTGTIPDGTAASGTLLNVAGTPTILGFKDWDNLSSGQGYRLSASLFQASGSITIGSNAAVAGMPVKLSNISGTGGGTAWSSVEGNQYFVGPSPTQAGFSLYNDQALTSKFDCSGFQSLTSLTLTYPQSANYVSHMRSRVYVDPQMETTSKAFYDSFYTFGGGGASQLNIADAWGGTWHAMGDEINGYMSIAGCTACSITSGTLTLGGTVLGLFSVGDSIIGGNQPPLGTVTITSCAPVGGVLPCGANSGDTLTLSAGSVNMSGLPLRDVRHFASGQFPIIKSWKDFNAEHN